MRVSEDTIFKTSVATGISTPGTDSVLKDAYKDTINLFKNFETIILNLKKLYDNRLKAANLSLEIKSKKDFVNEGLKGDVLTKALEENQEKRKELLRLKKQPTLESDKEIYLKDLYEIMFRLDLRTSSVKNKVGSSNYVGSKNNKFTYDDLLNLIVNVVARDHEMMYDGKTRKFKSCYQTVFEMPKEMFGIKPEEPKNFSNVKVKDYSKEAFLTKLEKLVAYKDKKIIEKLKEDLSKNQENMI